MRTVIGGASGLIGSALVRELRSGGNDVARLVRGQPQPGDIAWDPAGDNLDPAAINGADAIIHLSGESIAGGRWTAERKQSIRDSRVKSTALLARSMVLSKQRPKVWLCASAIGWYGNRGSEWVDENAASGDGFLARVCQEWEDATKPAVDAGIRVANLRFGVVFSRDGGALKQMVSAFQFGVGGVIGDGEQYISWIALEDAVAACLHALNNPFVRGPVNLTSPEPVTNRQLTKAIGAVLHRPTILPMPAFAARLAFGEMADEMLLASTRVRPARLLDSGFSFTYATLDSALGAILRA